MLTVAVGQTQREKCSGNSNYCYLWYIISNLHTYVADACYYPIVLCVTFFLFHHYCILTFLNCFHFFVCGLCYRLPTEATFEPTPTGMFTPTETNYVFVTMGDYVKQLFGWSESTAVSGLFSRMAGLKEVGFFLMIFQCFFKGFSSCSTD